MKGFPNQIADLSKLSRGLSTVAQLLNLGANPRDDGVFGEALVRNGIIGTGHRPVSVEQYLQEQSRKSRDRQSFQTTARGLRELYQLLGLIEYRNDTVALTADGLRAAAFANQSMNAEQVEFWRRIIRNMRHFGGDDTASHPYEVLLRLIARKPDITRAKCALALEARDDSPEELNRIERLSELSEERIRAQLAISKSNWDNAKKILPRFAEQLGDVVKTGQSYRIADAPGMGATSSPRPARERSEHENFDRSPRGSRSVTADSIGQAGIAERDEPLAPPTIDPAAMLAANQTRADRLRRHNNLVRDLSARLSRPGLELFEAPFDMLAVYRRLGILAEVKTLDGTESDERNQVRDSLGQLLYYEAFLARPEVNDLALHKLAVFEGPISVHHQRLLNESRIAVIWKSGSGFAGDALSSTLLGPYLEELG